MANYFDVFHGIDFHGTEAVNFRNQEVSTLPLTPFTGQVVFLNTVDGIHDANTIYAYDGAEWRSITHHDLEIAEGSQAYLDITGHELSIKSLLMHNYVYDNTNTSINAWITDYGYTGTQLQAGDELYLDAATDGKKAYKHNGGTAGTSADFFLVSDALTDAEIRGKFASGEGTTYISADGSFDVNHDHATININAQNELYVVDEGITTAKLADGAVTAVKIGADAVTAVKINADVAGAGIVQNGTTGALDVNVDGSTIEIATDTVQVKDLGITEAKLATAVATKINDSAVANVGDGVASAFTVTHNLGTKDIIVFIRNTVDDKFVAFQSLNGCASTINTITFDFGATVPSVDQYRVIIKKAV